jgi:class 3 adenylate cyclase
MEASYSHYDYTKSVERITEILNSSDASYENKTGIPSRDQLTFDNGFYVDVTVVFVDMRGSKALAAEHTRPVLAKIYRAYISELVAVLRGNEYINEIYIEGDGVWAVFNTTKKNHIDTVFSTVCQLASLTDILNVKLKKKGYSTISVGIGMDDGDSLYIKAGYKGAAINEVVWIGKVVGNAAKLCKDASRPFHTERILVSNKVHDNFNEENQKFFTYITDLDCYQGDVVNSLMERWVQDNG